MRHIYEAMRLLGFQVMTEMSFMFYALSVSRHLRVTAVRDAFPAPATPLNLSIFGHGPQDVTTLTGHTSWEAAVRITHSGLKSHVDQLVMGYTSTPGM